MRAKLALAALVAGAATTLAPSPASAVCNLALYELTGYCSHCAIIGIPYGIVDAATGDRYLPSLECAQ
jgi:hypothetical protein